jgi:hypothetical protein
MPSGIRKDPRFDHRQFALGQHDLASSDALDGTVDTTSDPVIPRSSFARDGSATSFRRATTRGEITLLDAPVSTTNANGPTPFTNTGRHHAANAIRPRRRDVDEVFRL